MLPITSPFIARYAIVSLMAAMFTRGWLSPEHNAILGENLDIIVSVIVGLLTVLYALIRRPSAKAMEAARKSTRRFRPRRMS